MLNLNDLQLFVRVVDHGGFAAAARALECPKSTLSKRVAALETALGVRLIQRSSRVFVMTDTGKAFYRHAAAMLIEAEAAENVVRGLQAEPTGLVRITASVTTAQLVLAELLPVLAERHPRLQVMLHATDRFVDLVQEGFDIGVRDHSAPLADSELVQRRVGFEPFYLVAAPAYLARHGGPPTDWQALAGHDGLLLSAAASAQAWTLWQGGKAHTVRPRPRFFADEPWTLLHAALAGVGVGCLPRGLCAASLASGRLVRLLPAFDHAGGMTTTLLIAHRRGQLPSVRAAVDFLADGIAQSRGLETSAPAAPWL
ncbi:LysR substrate-binding domain-containing protein [Acidovorax sp.]|uniref:LysR substrate-binding domain-containing protein n=1 Tax=Acidovorax sp. TaxID=1872122 RepID=UPI00391D488B